MVFQFAMSYLSNAVAPQQPVHSFVGVYEMQQTLGRGNFGKVRRVRHLLTGHYFAVKIVPISVLNQGFPANLDIRREMSILRSLSHPNIVRLHDVMVSDKRVYLVMDLAAGGDFYSLITSQTSLPEHITRRYFRQLVDAVHYCHQSSIFHRDLKPENLLLDASGNLKVTDFGFSAMKDNDHMLLRTNCGSPHYCAPEVWNGSQKHGYDGAKADAFSIGVILYVLLSGAQPFAHKNERAVLHLVNKCKVEYPSSLSPDAVDLMKKLIVKNPERRWSLDMVKKHPWYVAPSLERSRSVGSIPKPTLIKPKPHNCPRHMCLKCGVRANHGKPIIKADSCGSTMTVL